jgi:hypothetical protein
MLAEYTRNIRWNEPNRTQIYVYFVEHFLPEIGIADRPHYSKIPKYYIKYSRISLNIPGFH